MCQQVPFPPKYNKPVENDMEEVFTIMQTLSFTVTNLLVC